MVKLSDLSPGDFLSPRQDSQHWKRGDRLEVFTLGLTRAHWFVLGKGCRVFLQPMSDEGLLHGFEKVSALETA